MVMVAAAGNAESEGCDQNPLPQQSELTDPTGWRSAKTIATPAWFSDYRRAVSASDSAGLPITGQSGSL
jgi:membrane-anchored mycosin MYCP